ncbi:hypothetical protein PR048_005716 [Dryococelus australis]|uniref:Uncharacterized protein n=1 Tax=Dryococelus australis TaxID=614101 RepID=A0ABQ9I900_9NEOP|nr:hypothetical protein PR048_005716 [Dryococelus australis]
MAVVKPKDIMNSIALLKHPKGSTVPEIIKFLRQSNLFLRATPATKLAIHQALSRLCEQGLLTFKNSRYQANTLARTMVRRRRSRRRRRSVRRRSRRRASISKRRRRSVRRKSRRRASTSRRRASTTRRRRRRRSVRRRASPVASSRRQRSRTGRRRAAETPTTTAPTSQGIEK